MVKAGYVFEQVRALIDDQAQDFADDAYLRTFLQMAQDDFVQDCLRDTNIGEVKAAVVIPNIAAGTTSLAQELLPDGKLGLLSSPIELREKKAGDPDINYINMIPRYVPIQQSTQNSYNLIYTYTGNDIMLPGANQAVDIWVWGAFSPAKIQNADSPLVHDTESILRYATAKLVAKSRSNAEKAADFEKDQRSQQAAWMRAIYKVQQSMRVVNRPWRPKTGYWFDPPSS